MDLIKNNLVLAIALGLLGTAGTLTAVQASTSGWGVDNAKPVEQRTNARHRRGHGYMIWYGSHRGHRGRGGSYGGGGFRGGK